MNVGQKLQPSPGIVIEATDANDDEGVFCVRISDALEAFRGHFPGAPVMPAVAQLDSVVLPCIDALSGQRPSLRHATKLKFQNPIGPGAVLRLRCTRVQGDRYRFVLSDWESDGPHSSGTLLFAPDSESVG